LLHFVPQKDAAAIGARSPVILSFEKTKKFAPKAAKKKPENFFRLFYSFL